MFKHAVSAAKSIGLASIVKAVFVRRLIRMRAGIHLLAAVVTGLSSILALAEDLQPQAIPQLAEIWIKKSIPVPPHTEAIRLQKGRVLGYLIKNPGSQLHYWTWTGGMSGEAGGAPLCDLQISERYENPGTIIPGRILVNQTLPTGWDPSNPNWTTIKTKTGPISRISCMGANGMTSNDEIRDALGVTFKVPDLKLPKRKVVDQQEPREQDAHGLRITFLPKTNGANALRELDARTADDAEIKVIGGARAVQTPESRICDSESRPCGKAAVSD